MHLGKSSVSPQGGFEPFCSSVFEAAACCRSRLAGAATVPRQPTLVRVVEDSCCFVFPTHARAQLSHSRRHLKTDYCYNGKSRNISKEKKNKKYKSTMCSSSPVKEKDQQEKKSATTTSCCPGSFSRTRKVARALVKRLHTNPCKM